MINGASFENRTLEGNSGTYIALPYPGLIAERVGLIKSARQKAIEYGGEPAAIARQAIRYEAETGQDARYPTDSRWMEKTGFLGNKLIFPVRFRLFDIEGKRLIDTYELPGEPLVSIRRQKRFVERELNNPSVRGSILEQTSATNAVITLEDWIVSENGIYPWAEFERLQSFFDMQGRILIDCMKPNLAGITEVQLVDLDTPDSPDDGEELQSYTLVLKEDVPFDFLIEQ